MSTWVKLGPKASIFVDIRTKLEVISQEQPVEVTRMSKRIKEAIAGGHLVEVANPTEAQKESANLFLEESQKDPNKILGLTPATPDSGKTESKGGKGGKTKSKPEPQGPKLEKMTDDQLVAYYNDNFEVTPEDLTTFKGLSREEKVAFLIEE